MEHIQEGGGFEGVAGVPIAPYPIPIGALGGKPCGGIGGVPAPIDPVPTGPKSEGFIVARSRMNCSFCSPGPSDTYAHRCRDGSSLSPVDVLVLLVPFEAFPLPFSGLPHVVVPGAPRTSFSSIFLD